MSRLFTFMITVALTACLLGYILAYLLGKRISNEWHAEHPTSVVSVPITGEDADLLGQIIVLNRFNVTLVVEGRNITWCINTPGNAATACSGSIRGSWNMFLRSRPMAGNR
jgi:hypothetical protein